MIINLRKVKILAVIAAIILIPLIGINLINWSLRPKTEISAQSVLKPAPATVTVNNSLPASDSQEPDFFSEYRLQRERVRGTELGMLKELVNNPASEKRVRDAASLKLMDLSARAEKEMQAEAIIKSQGWRDCIVITSPPHLTVMIENKPETTANLAGIRKTASIVTGYAEKNITVLNP